MYKCNTKFITRLTAGWKIWRRNAVYSLAQWYSTNNWVHKMVPICTSTCFRQKLLGFYFGLELFLQKMLAIHVAELNRLTQNLYLLNVHGIWQLHELHLHTATLHSSTAFSPTTFAQNINARLYNTRLLSITCSATHTPAMATFHVLDNTPIYSMAST